MYRFIEILLLPTQFVFLTGTLPLIYEKDFKETLKLESLSVIRAPSSRREISYNTKVYSSLSKEGQLEEVRSYVDSYRTKLSSYKDKILIICPTIPSIIELGEAIGCPVYYAALENKEEVLNRFLTTNNFYNIVLVSSSALEEGLDYPHIRLVVYKDFAYSFLSFLQGSGRGGRDGNKSVSMFFHYKGEEEERENDSLDKSTLRKYLKEEVCKRRVINLFLDNSLVDKCSKEEELCCLCLSRQNIHLSTINTIKSSSINIERNREDFKAKFFKLSASCIYCSLMLNTLCFDHSSYHCPLSKEINIEEEKISKYLKEQGSSYLKKDSCCFNCFLPTTICSTTKRESKGVSYCYNIIFIPRVLSLFFFKQEELKVKERFNIISTLKTWKSLAPYFFRKVFIKELNTEGVFGVSILLEILKDLKE
jgi:hypothetical protein